MIKKAEYFERTGLKVLITKCLYSESCNMHGNHIGEVAVKCADGNYVILLENGRRASAVSFRLVKRYPRTK